MKPEDLAKRDMVGVRLLAENCLQWAKWFSFQRNPAWGASWQSKLYWLFLLCPWTVLDTLVPAPAEESISSTTNEGSLMSWNVRLYLLYKFLFRIFWFLVQCLVVHQCALLLTDPTRRWVLIPRANKLVSPPGVHLYNHMKKIFTQEAFVADLKSCMNSSLQNGLTSSPAFSIRAC